MSEQSRERMSIYVNKNTVSMLNDIYIMKLKKNGKYCKYSVVEEAIESLYKETLRNNRIDDIGEPNEI